MTKLHELHDTFDVSPWLDNLSRELIRSGGLKNYVDQGVRGVTSNPSIFEKAFANGSYASACATLKQTGMSTEQAYWQMAIEDIQAACDILRPVYEESNKDDGYVSLEVSPKLARSADQTTVQAKELWSRVNRPNLMIKIPATEECIPAIADVLALGINVNVTLIFSLHRYLQVINAYISGLEKLGDPASVRSVASFFISRVDSEVDPSLDAPDLKGLAALAQARAAYGIYLESFNELADRWNALAQRGAKPQKPLWASTSTKDPGFPDLKYVDGLLAKNTVNTLPDATISAIIDHANFENKQVLSPTEIEDAHEQLSALMVAGVNMKLVSAKLEQEGVDKFQQAFDSMLSALDL